MLFAAGKDRRNRAIVDDIDHHTISVLGAATSFGGYVSLSAREAFDVEYWPLELYKLSLAPPEKELARRIALVTGGASGIGRAAPAAGRRGRARAGGRPRRGGAQGSRGDRRPTGQGAGDQLGWT
jgi:hypothetical protein